MAVSIFFNHATLFFSSIKFQPYLLGETIFLMLSIILTTIKSIINSHFSLLCLVFPRTIYKLKTEKYSYQSITLFQNSRLLLPTPKVTPLSQCLNRLLNFLWTISSWSQIWKWQKGPQVQCTHTISLFSFQGYKAKNISTKPNSSLMVSSSSSPFHLARGEEWEKLLDPFFTCLLNCLSMSERHTNFHLSQGCCNSPMRSFIH